MLWQHSDKILTVQLILKSVSEQLIIIIFVTSKRILRITFLYQHCRHWYSEFVVHSNADCRFCYQSLRKWWWNSLVTLVSDIPITRWLSVL